MTMAARSGSCGPDDDSAAAAITASEWRWRDGAMARVDTALAVETPIALEYNGIAHAVMLATPCDLEDFALGFSLSEGILTEPTDLYRVDVRKEAQGITLALEVAAGAFAALKLRRRTLAGRTGCGICGTESLEQVLRPLPELAQENWQLSAAALAVANADLSGAQPLSQQTGATHAAAWCATDGKVVLVREDVGRHNALDKLIGALRRSRVPVDRGFALITSRASVEMVQKTATAGICILAAVSAPTSLALQVAQRSGVTLIGFARGAAFSVYTHRARIAAVP
ncbi:MAG TPA: formate dehydrogenase accessory sulfurtransferase FdhD [Burkholderiaceae bacterium]|nr:formate dehydrogenase accessory sulfurtransferase FdhD [Burkholderiaceae bacterium]